MRGREERPAAREAGSPRGVGERDAGRAVLPLVFDAVGLERDGRRLLHNLSFRLERGSVSVILGPNGAGKSLTLRLCDGLLTPTRGQVRWLGPDAAHTPRPTALVLQRPVLLRRSVAANVDYALRLRGVPRALRRTRRERVLAAVGLAERAARPARRLSVGQQQRLAIARAWALEPPVLLLDEPAAALDPGAARALEEAIRRVRAGGTKIVLTTHDLGQARRLADEVLFLDRGRLLEHTPAAEFLDAPRSAEGGPS